MKYSDIPALEIKYDHTPKYRLCYRTNASKTGKFKGVYKNLCTTFIGVFNFALIDASKVIDLFSEDGKYMLVECRDGDERVILPDELKTLLTREYDNIVSDFHKYDENDGSMYEPCLKILNAIDSNIK